MPKIPPIDLSTIDPMLRGLRADAIRRRVERSTRKTGARERARRVKQADHAHRVAESIRLENAAMIERSCKRLREPAQRAADRAEADRQRAA